MVALPVNPTFFRHTRHLFFFADLVRGVSVSEVLVSSGDDSATGEACKDAGRSERGVAFIVLPATCIQAASCGDRGRGRRRAGGKLVKRCSTQ